MAYARQLFDQIPDPNIAPWNAMFKGYIGNEMYMDVVLLFGHIINTNVKRNYFIIPMVLKSCVKLSALRNGEKVHCFVLIELEPENPSNYVMLSNIYGDAKRWGDLARSKVAMRNTGAKKLPGCSLIEVDDGVVEFYAFDERHLKTEEIYSAIKSLIKVSKDTTYMQELMEHQAMLWDGTICFAKRLGFVGVFVALLCVVLVDLLEKERSIHKGTSYRMGADLTSQRTEENAIVENYICGEETVNEMMAVETGTYRWMALEVG
ncbi:hypothetical protein SSX86_032016 [Deinandra increscens subsp. villosa]|uniref:Uncharacterized protein n=1 Tax=Deinandra increscens subsp. villosa TaxID=3103831 RepID=A0AAP0GI57_9ASTR